MRALKKRRIVSIAEFSIHPIGTGTSVGKYVKGALEAISRIEGLEYQVTPMATILEAKDVQTMTRQKVSRANRVHLVFCLYSSLLNMLCMKCIGIGCPLLLVS